MGEPLTDDSGQFIDAQLPKEVDDAGATRKSPTRAAPR
jgi:hypothetical protein